MTDIIKNPVAANALAELVLSMGMTTEKGLIARALARAVLGVPDCGQAPAASVIVTNGTARVIPRDEPVFLLRGQDKVAAACVRVWADISEAEGAASDIVRTARAHADLMDAWPKKKLADLPITGATA